MARPLLLASLLLTVSAAAPVEVLVVGQGGLPWNEVLGETRFVSIEADAIKTGTAAAGLNLGPQALERGGIFARVVARDSTVVLLPLPELEYLLDGRPETSFDPQKAGVPPDTEIYIDLGAAHRLARIRFFPRQNQLHRDRFLQFFELGGNNGLVSIAHPEELFAIGYSTLLRFSNAVTGNVNDRSIFDWPGNLETSGRMEARYLRLKPLHGLPYEIAELELYSDGTVPAGQAVSLPLLARGQYPVWGRVRLEGQGPPAIVQVRTGPTPTTVQYFIETAAGIEQVSRDLWLNIANVPSAGRRGEIKPHPDWSAWTGLQDGLVPSRRSDRYLQFRLRLVEPNLVLRRLVFEYSFLPLAGELLAEIHPSLAAPGRQTAFALTVQTLPAPDAQATGLRYIEVSTGLEIEAVDSVRVEGTQVDYTIENQDPKGFTVNLWFSIV